MNTKDLQPQKMEWVEMEHAGELILDDRWAAEQKADGVHVMAVVEDGDVRFIGVGGGRLTHAASALHFPRLREELLRWWSEHEETFVLDGELICETGVFWVYDLPYWSGHVVPEHEFDRRRGYLEAIEPNFGPSFRVLPQAVGQEAKLALTQAVLRNEGEGIVYKRLDAPFEPGVRVKHQLKLKFVKTADCVVLELGRGANNAVLGMWTDEAMVEVGSASMIGKDPEIQVGSVVEVKYLYATKDLVLYQPRITRLRHDKDQADCLRAQLSPVSREVLV